MKASKQITLAGWLLAVALALAGCDGNPARAERSEAGDGLVAVSNSWLECCLRELAGDDFEPVRVCPPGSCPGHFDIRPGTVAALRECRLVLLFNFQRSMEERLRAIAPERLELAAIDAPAGLCVPASYLAGCEAVLAALGEAFPERRGDYEAALERARERMGRLEVEMREQVRAAGLEGVRVMASGHQELFCRWLGLEPVAVYSGPNTQSPARIEALLADGRESGIGFVIANAQEGAQVGQALAHQLDVPLVVMSNFPLMEGEEHSFDGLVRTNVARLVAAARESRP